jgi:hypothetical protein
VLSADADLADLTGLSAQYQGFTISTDQLAPGVAAVTVTGGTTTGSVDPSQLPLASYFKDLLGVALNGKPHTETSPASAPMVLGTEEVGGSWYVSLGYSIAINDLKGQGQSGAPPAASEALPALDAYAPDWLPWAQSAIDSVKAEVSIVFANLSFALELIDYCRAQQGVGPLRLPSNFDRLTVPEQALVMIDLERVNRGEVPVAGLTAPLDRLAQQAAVAGTDPAIGFGDIWEGGATSTVEADYGWMYDDGYLGVNVDCTAPANPACWGPRDIILVDDFSGALVAGAGFETGLSYGNSYALGLADYVPGSRLVFSWAGKLRYFRVPPGLEPLASGHGTQPLPASR